MSVTVSIDSPSICHEVMGLDAMILAGADGNHRHEIKRCLVLGRKAMTNLDSILKNRDITLLTIGSSTESYGFSSSHVWM